MAIAVRYIAGYCTHSLTRLLDLGGLEMKLTTLSFVLAAALLQGCVLTKVATVPMRLGGAVISVVPGVGNSAHDAIDEAAEKVDDIPI